MSRFKSNEIRGNIDGLMSTACTELMSRFKSNEIRGNIDGLMSTACTELMTAWSNTNRNLKVTIQWSSE